MDRKRIVWFSAAATAISLLLFFLLRSPITIDNANRIHKGMTFSRVVDILGQPTEMVKGDVRRAGLDSHVWKRGGLRIDIVFLDAAFDGGIVRDVSWEMSDTRPSLFVRAYLWLSQMF